MIAPFDELRTALHSGVHAPSYDGIQANAGWSQNSSPSARYMHLQKTARWPPKPSLRQKLLS